MHEVAAGAGAEVTAVTNAEVKLTVGGFQVVEV
jgi:hypothetical protein